MGKVMAMVTEVDVLGVVYQIEHREFGAGADCDGFCDFSSKHIVIRSDNANNLEDFEWLQKKQLRHEVIHAFLAESGLQANFEHCNRFGHDETMIDWVAIQFPKLMKAFKAAGCL